MASQEMFSLDFFFEIWYFFMWMMKDEIDKIVEEYQIQFSYELMEFHFIYSLVGDERNLNVCKAIQICVGGDFREDFWRQNFVHEPR